MARSLTRALVGKGARELAARDPALARIHRRLGDPPVWGRRPGFAALVKIILEQQVSLRSAAAIYRRIDAHVGGVTPRALDRLGVVGLRRLGVTRQKAAYCHGLARRILDGMLDLAAIARGPDEEGRRRLLDVPGLGPWSVDIYFLMALRRPDVWPRGDLALAAALREVKGLRALPSHGQQEELSRAWTPWRSVAARILWAHYLSQRGRPV
ncbi:MAG TPA: DNA-3-methyladenine glycosylase 2 family protein [Planctomycetota bacterium]|nr:DNA-3-methyladenine glycosylase 2 family protein [Planctomycetota bacterium]